MDALSFLHMLNGLLMLVLPLGLAIFLTRQWRIGWRLWLIGAAIFLLSQVFHYPFISYMGDLLNRTPLATLSQEARLLITAAFLGLSAGLFEELFRYGMFRWWAKDARSWRSAILTGAGHGGAEAILLGMIVMFVYFQFLAIRNLDLSTVFSGDQLPLAREQVAAYWSMNWYDSVLGALERLFTIPTQIALAVLVVQAFIRKQAVWVWLAVLYHALLDATAIITASLLGIYWTEAVSGIFATLSIIIIFRLRRPEPEPAPDRKSAIPPPVFTSKPVEETAENLDSSRYS